MISSPVEVALKFDGTTQTDLARKLGTSRQLISRSNLGMAVNLNRNLVNWLAETLSACFDNKITAGEIDRWYDTFVYQKRVESGIKYGFIKLFKDHYKADEIRAAAVPTPDSPVAEFIAWREKYFGASYWFFCEQFCVNPALVFDFEKGRVKKMPRHLKEALEVIRTLKRHTLPPLERM